MEEIGFSNIVLYKNEKTSSFFKAIPTPLASQERLDKFHRYAKEAVGPGVEITTEFVDSLDIGPGGKLRPAQSNIHTDYEAIDWDNTI